MADTVAVHQCKQHGVVENALIDIRNDTKEIKNDLKEIKDRLAAGDVKIATLDLKVALVEKVMYGIGGIVGSTIVLALIGLVMKGNP